MNISEDRICPLCGKANTAVFARIQKRNYLKCPECLLLFLAPLHRLDREEEKERYLLHNNSPDDVDYRKFLGQLADCLTPELSPGMKGLDFGSGPGPTLSVMLEEQGFRMTIYDPFFAPDASALEGEYDFITCTETVEHFYDPAREFFLLNSLLKEGGWLGIMTGMFEPEQSFEEWYYPTDPTHVSFYRQETMNWLASHFNWTARFPRKNVILFQK